MRCKDGASKYVMINANGLWENGEFIQARCFTRDITSSKQAEEAQGRLAAIVESSHDAIISKTLGGRIVSWNREAERLFGYSAAEAIGEPITVLIPKDRLGEEETIIARLRRGERIEEHETVRLSKQGERLQVSLSVSPVLDASGRVVGASKILRDISVRRRTELAIRRSEATTRFLADASAALAELTDVELRCNDSSSCRCPRSPTGAPSTCRSPTERSAAWQCSMPTPPDSSLPVSSFTTTRHV